MKRVHLIIRGDVQGVSFRAWTIQQARELGVTGWVRNKDDGTVEIVAEGNRASLEELAARCQRGPETAQVMKVEVNWSEASGEFFRFEVVL